MNVAFLTPGTGSYYCGACMRDNALVNALIKDGHEALLLPMYLPLMLDEESKGQANDAPVFFGGINIYLQQKMPIFRRTPNWFDRLFNSVGLLRSVAKRSHMTSAQLHGEMTEAMLRLDSEQFEKELEKLFSWLGDHTHPDVFCLSTAMMSGFARDIKKRYDVPVICYFQGEDTFLDSLPPEYRESCWAEMKIRVQDADLLLAPSASYARMMEGRLDLPHGTINTLHNGINLTGFEPNTQKADTPTIGYLARMCKDKGLDRLVDAYIYFRKNLDSKPIPLKIAGAVTAGDETLIESLKKKLEKEGLAQDVQWLPNLSREEKLTFLSSLTLFSVPTIYEEAFGLYIVEALAAGAVAVQPNIASFPEILKNTGGGLCVEPNNPKAMATAWLDLLNDPQRLTQMSQSGQAGVIEHYSVDVMKTNFLKTVEPLLKSSITSTQNG